MKTQKNILLIIILLIFCTGIHGFSQEKSLVNTQVIDGAKIKSIDIRYISANVTIIENNDDQIVLKEYMNHNDPEYFALISKTAGSLKIEAGKRPPRIKLSVNVEIYMPQKYYNKLSVVTTSGKINVTTKFNAGDVDITSTSGTIALQPATVESIQLKTTSGRIEAENITGNITAQSTSGNILIKSTEGSKLNISCTSGTIELEKIKSDVINLKNTSGKMIADNISGKLTAQNTSGQIRITNAEGMADLKSTSGAVTATYQRVNGNISAQTTSGKVGLTIPQNTSYSFDASTTSGNIQASFLDKGISKRPKTISYKTDNSPQIKIKINTVSGSIDFITL